MSIWDRHPQAIELLRTMIAQGQSCGRIASVIAAATGEKVTRNAVIGKALRMGLRGDVPRDVLKRRATLNQRASARTFKPRVQRPKLPPKPRPPKLSADKKPKPEGLPPPRDFHRPHAVRFLDRDQTQCPFPISGDGADMLMCGNALDKGQTYCAECARIAYQKQVAA